MECIPITQILFLFNKYLGNICEEEPDYYRDIRRDSELSIIDNHLESLMNHELGKLWLL